MINRLSSQAAGALRRSGVVVLVVATVAFGQWSDPVNISNTTGYFSGNTSLEFDANGNIHLAFLDFVDQDTRVYYANNVGGSWTKTQVKSWGSGNTSGPALVITPDQTIHIFYNHSGTYVISKPVSGGSWSSATRLDNNQPGGCSPPDPSHPSSFPSSNYFASAGADSTGGILVVWQSLFNDNFNPRNAIWARYKPAGGSWGCLELIAGTSNDGNFPAEANVADNGSDLFVTWHNRDGVYYRKRSSTGTWDAPVQVNDGGGFIRMDFSPLGEWGVVHHEDVDGTASGQWFEIFVRTSQDQGATWSSAFNLSNKSNLDRKPHLTYDDQGNLHVVWELFNCDGCKPEVYYQARINGIWEPRVNLTNRPGGRDGLNQDESIRAYGNTLYATFNSTSDGYEDVFIRDTLPYIDVTPTSFTSDTWIGSNASNDSFTIRNSGPGTLSYSLSDDADWLSLSPISGDSSGELDTITIQYDVAGFLAGTYNAVITVTAPGAQNTPVYLPVTVHVNTVDPDHDGDGDVDQVDFGAFQHCMSGAGIPQADPDCEWAQLDAGDNDVDQDDLDVFIGCMSTPNVPADPQCMP